MKKIMSAALALAMTLTLAPTAFAAGGTAYASTQAVEVLSLIHISEPTRPY